MCRHGDPSVHGNDAQRWVYSPGAVFVTACRAACGPAMVVKTSTMVNLKNPTSGYDDFGLAKNGILNAAQPYEPAIRDRG